MNRRIEVKSVRSQVYEQIREMILDGVWEPGSNIDLTNVAAEFGVSKTPLNEAVQKLLQEGLLTVKPRSGTFVSQLSMDEINQTFDFRLALETGAAQSIIEQLTDETLKKLGDVHSEMTRTAATDSLNRRKMFLRLDSKFHDLIIASCGNPLILNHYRQVNSLSFVSRGRGEMMREDYDSALADHEDIIAALKARNIQHFRKACRLHVAGAKRKLEAALKRAAAKD